MSQNPEGEVIGTLAEWVCVGCEKFVSDSETVPKKGRGRDQGKPCCPDCGHLLLKATGKCFRCGGETTTRFPAPGYIMGHCSFCEGQKREKARLEHPERYLPPVKFIPEEEHQAALTQAAAVAREEERERIVGWLEEMGGLLTEVGLKGALSALASEIEAGTHAREEPIP